MIPSSELTRTPSQTTHNECDEQYGRVHLHGESNPEPIKTCGDEQPVGGNYSFNQERGVFAWVFKSQFSFGLRWNFPQRKVCQTIPRLSRRTETSQLPFVLACNQWIQKSAGTCQGRSLGSDYTP